MTRQGRSFYHFIPKICHDVKSTYHELTVTDPRTVQNPNYMTRAKIKSRLEVLKEMPSKLSWQIGSRLVEDEGAHQWDGRRWRLSWGKEPDWVGKAFISRFLLFIAPK